MRGGGGVSRRVERICSSAFINKNEGQPRVLCMITGLFFARNDKYKNIPWSGIPGGFSFISFMTLKSRSGCV